MSKQGFLIDISRDRLKITLTEEVTSIGRSASNTIRINSKNCSRKHCQIRRTDEIYLLKGKHSGSGIKVNGFYVRERELQTGDEIDIAGRSFIFNIEDLPETRPSTEMLGPLPPEKKVTAEPVQPQPKSEKPKVTYLILFLTAVRSAIIMVLVLLAGMLVFHIGVRQGWLQLRGDITMDNIWKWMCYGLFIGLGLQLGWGILSLIFMKPKKNKTKVIKRITKAPKQ